MNDSWHQITEPWYRLKWAWEKADYRFAKDAAVRFGWNVATYRSHERPPPEAGGTGRRFDTGQAEDYAKAFRINAAWLLGVEGSTPFPVRDFEPKAPKRQTSEEELQGVEASRPISVLSAVTHEQLRLALKALFQNLELGPSVFLELDGHVQELMSAIQAQQDAQSDSSEHTPLKKSQR